MVIQSSTQSSSNSPGTVTTSTPESTRRPSAVSHAVATSPSTSENPRSPDHPTTPGRCGSVTAAKNDASGLGSEARSVGSGPITASRAAATSWIDRAMGPLELSSSQPGASRPPLGTRPREAFIPDRPHAAEGIRIEPPPSDPVAMGTMPAAMAAAEPPEDPPGEWSRFHGFLVSPWRAFSVRVVQPNSGVLVLPTTTQPAWRSRATREESARAGLASSWRGEPCVVGRPAASSRSLTPIGMPASGPGSPPEATI